MNIPHSIWSNIGAGVVEYHTEDHVIQRLGQMHTNVGTSIHDSIDNLVCNELSVLYTSTSSAVTYFLLSPQYFRSDPRLEGFPIVE
jgi:hypothetical protein